MRVGRDEGKGKGRRERKRRVARATVKLARRQSAHIHLTLNMLVQYKDFLFDATGIEPVARDPCVQGRYTSRTWTFWVGMG